ETRLVPSAARVYLAFNGAVISAEQMQQGGWNNYQDQTISSFRNLFNASRPWLDINGDGKVNGVDAAAAIEKVGVLVSKDFRAYDVFIDWNPGTSPDDAALSLLSDGSPGDVVVMVTGDYSFVPNQSVLGREGFTPFGASPWVDQDASPSADVGNTHDD